MKINWTHVLQAFNPLYVTRRYSLDFGDYCGGRVENFWFYANALRRFKELKDNNAAPFIALADLFRWPMPGDDAVFSSSGNYTVLKRYRDESVKPPVRSIEIDHGN